MTTWTDDDHNPGLAINKLTFDEPDTLTLEEYHRWRDQTLFEAEPYRVALETIRLKGDCL